MGDEERGKGDGPSIDAWYEAMETLTLVGEVLSSVHSEQVRTAFFFELRSRTARGQFWGSLEETMVGGERRTGVEDVGVAQAGETSRSEQDRQYEGKRHTG